MKIGLFGGTFDPTHSAHLILADEAVFQLSLSQVHFVLTPEPPHKNSKYISQIKPRLEMLETAIENNPQFVLSRVDIERKPPYYAIDTVKIYKDEYLDSHICYLMGGDSLHDLPDWHNPQEFVEVCDSIGVMRRGNDQIDINSLEKVLPGVINKISLLDTPLIEISGSKIRQYIASGRPYRYYLPDRVYRIIEKYHLYR